jgi:hypothetical protein
MEAIRPAADRLKGLAVGAALGLVRDMLAPQIPGDLGGEIKSVIDDLTVNLGGHPIRNMGLKETSTSET